MSDHDKQSPFRAAYDRNIQSNIRDFYKILGDEPPAVVGLAIDENTDEFDDDKYVFILARRAIVHATSNILTSSLLLAVYGGYKFFLVSSASVETRIVFFGSLAAFVLTAGSALLLDKTLATRSKMGCLPGCYFSTTELCVLAYAAYLLFYRGLYYPFFGSAGFSWAGLGMAAVFAFLGIVVSKGIWVYSTAERAITNRGIELVAMYLKAGRQHLREQATSDRESPE